MDGLLFFGAIAAVVGVAIWAILNDGQVKARFAPARSAKHNARGSVKSRRSIRDFGRR